VFQHRIDAPSPSPNKYLIWREKDVTQKQQGATFGVPSGTKKTQFAHQRVASLSKRLKMKHLHRAACA
jgi:hypothetical protein